MGEPHIGQNPLWHDPTFFLEPVSTWTYFDPWTCPIRPVRFTMLSLNQIAKIYTVFQERTGYIIVTSQYYPASPLCHISIMFWRVFHMFLFSGDLGERIQRNFIYSGGREDHIGVWSSTKCIWCFSKRSFQVEKYDDTFTYGSGLSSFRVLLAADSCQEHIFFFWFFVL